MATAAVTAAITQSAPVSQINYWMRLCLGSECYNKEAVRNVLHNKFNNPAYQGLPDDPAHLFQELKKFQSKLSELKSKHRITKAQWKLLYPDTKQTDSTEFDIPLMVILLEHCTDLDAPVNGWDDSTPPLTDQGLSANSLRARQMRHFLYHYGNPVSMDKNEFLRKWTELEDIQSGLGCASVDMLDLKTGPLDPHKLTYFKCAVTYLEEGQKNLLELHESTASDVKMLIDEVSALMESQKNISHIDARVVKIISQYTDIYKQVQANEEMIKEHGVNIQKNASRIQQNTESLERRDDFIQKNAAGIQRNTESLEKHDIDIENLTTKMEDMKSHEEILSSGMRWNIPENVSNFYGRTGVLDDVRNHFQNSSYEKDYVAVVLSGLGGIGKTEVAAKYVRICDKEYENVIWLECNDLKTSLMRLASYLEIERNVFEIDVLTQRICRKLKNSQCMFVLNDVVDGQSIKEFMKNLKNMKSTPCVLITSQYREWDDVRIKLIPMDVFESDEAVGFLCECLPKYDTVEVEMLARELQYLPLALQQARSYLKKHARTTIPDYIRYLKDNRKELLNVRLNRTGGYDKTLLTVWKMAFDKLKEHGNFLAIDMLNMMAYMDGRFINIQTFLYLDNIDELKLNAAVEVLWEYSLIQLNNHTSISMHSLVQKITICYNKLAPLSSKDKDGYCLKLSILLSDIAEKQPLINHDSQNLWFRHLKKILLDPQHKVHLPSVSKLTDTALASGDDGFYMYILSVFIIYYKKSYHLSRKSEHFTEMLFCASSYAMALCERKENALPFVENISVEFEKEFAEKKTSGQLYWHYTHVMVLIYDNKIKEAIKLFDSLRHVEILGGTLALNGQKAIILFKLGRKEKALCTSRHVFEMLISKDNLVEYDSFLFADICDNFLLLGDNKTACLCLTHAEDLLQKLKVDMQSCYWYRWHFSKAVHNLYTHQYDACIQESNKCLLFPCNTDYDVDLMIGYAQLKQKCFENSKKKLTELLVKLISHEERELVLCYIGAALLCLDEINEAENVLKSLIAEDNYNNFRYIYLTKIEKCSKLKNRLNSYRKIYGDKHSKTIEVLHECIRIRKQLKECYNDVPHLEMITIFMSTFQR